MGAHRAPSTVPGLGPQGLPVPLRAMAPVPPHSLGAAVLAGALWTADPSAGTLG